MFADGTHMDTYELGLGIRKEVLGEAHVERSMANVSGFSRAAQDYTTEFCWGGIWGRPGLDRTERSLLNLGILTALNRMHEFGVHVRGAIRNGVTVQQIHEALLQAAMYVGIPAALESFRVAEKVIREELGDAAVDEFEPAGASDRTAAE
ncbi:carboxymuconolactone decarboxylase family protein [Microbacterium marinilacus]|mgnify:CR=1 FL=1|uniref:Carboxymuconolactone decarboxylase family protein n=1 Tax=Microbacterium marinilacus TaxID=415209 RepID=A0ABP7BIS6_9MICO|nr:carboxymuconolactone decarboxylase family protein [Microbacterium marinilacus]MBY0689726.1 carboxymuconolactone decarboxylase family protein [Microbacterium marinilacus]